jgi:hypothetical protein
MLRIVGGIDQRDLDPEPGQPLGQELRHPAINVALRDDVVAAAHQR